MDDFKGNTESHNITAIKPILFILMRFPRISHHLAVKKKE